MSITAIVYKSNTGFTREYAQMLAKAEKLKLYELSQAQLPKETEVLYMGPLMAGHISGVDTAVKNYTVKAVCGVGMTPPSPEVLTSLAKSNYVPQAPIFYLQGGWAPKKVGWIKRRMVGMATKSTREKLQKKSKRTPDEQKQLDFLIRGGSYVAYQNLEPLQRWLREQG